jgi:hypothetical protein
MGKGRDRAADSSTGLSRPTYAQPQNAKQKDGSTAGNEPKGFTPTVATVIGQWICFLLGAVCIVCGVFGICAKHIEGPLSVSVAWLGSAYMPTLWVASLLCLFIGLLLLRYGWGSPDHEQKKAKMKDNLEDVPLAYLLYIVLGILLVAVGAVIVIIRMF